MPLEWEKFLKNVKRVRGETWTLGFALLASIAGAWFVVSFGKDFDAAVAKAEEAARPVAIDITVIVPSVEACAACQSMDGLLNVLKSQPVDVEQEETVFADDEVGKAFVDSLGLERLPALIVTGDVTNPKLASFVSSYGVVKDGVLIAASPVPPYYQVDEAKVVGEVEAVYITDARCADCYDPSVHEKILTRMFGLHVSVARAVDITSVEGAALRRTYEIKTVPTVLLSPAAAAYASLVAVWPNVGDTASDGWYIFRRNDLMGVVVYKDLATGQVIRPVASQK